MPIKYIVRKAVNILLHQLFRYFTLNVSMCTSDQITFYPHAT